MVEARSEAEAVSLVAEVALVGPAVREKAVIKMNEPAKRASRTCKVQTASGENVRTSENKTRQPNTDEN